MRTNPFDRERFAAHRLNEVTDAKVFYANLASRCHDRSSAE
jgi:hypothetical protein